MPGSTNDIGKAGDPPQRTQRCPICRKPSVAAFRPFCSKRCADIDLSRWLTGGYAIPVVEEDGGHSDDGSDD